jgi:aryl carrier-like protein
MRADTKQLIEDLLDHAVLRERDKEFLTNLLYENKIDSIEMMRLRNVARKAGMLDDD